MQHMDRNYVMLFFSQKSAHKDLRAAEFSRSVRQMSGNQRVSFV